MRLSPNHAVIISRQINRQLAYLKKLRDRMQAKGFTAGDGQLRLVDNAIQAMSALSQELHQAGWDKIPEGRGAMPERTTETVARPMGLAWMGDPPGGETNY